ncbi:hypothetical protein CGH95_10545 [Vibrio parahaemolyticus]|nr:hypothetical protein CGH95_10545 [Vibrio parahaemolyticus]
MFDTISYLAKMAVHFEENFKVCSLKIRTYQSVWALVDDNPIRYLGIKLGFNETKWPLNLRIQHSQFKHYFM